LSFSTRPRIKSSTFIRITRTKVVSLPHIQFDRSDVHELAVDYVATILLVMLNQYCFSIDTNVRYRSWQTKITDLKT